MITFKSNPTHPTGYSPDMLVEWPTQWATPLTTVEDIRTMEQDFRANAIKILTKLHYHALESSQ